MTPSRQVPEASLDGGSAPDGHPVRTASGALDDLASLRTFAKVVETLSFSAAARRLGVSPGTVSKQVASLETRLGTRLINRTTRKLFVTDTGNALYARCVRVLGEVQQAEAELAQLTSEPVGHLRVAMPLNLGGQLIGPRIPEFMRAHPRIRLELDLSVDFQDVYGDQIDVAVRIADSLDPGVVAVRLAPYRRVFCASPEYVRRRGAPEHPDELVRHDCLLGKGAATVHAWPMVVEGRVRSVPITPRMVANNGDPVLAAAVAGLGVCMTARWLVERHLRSGALVEVLSGYAVENRSVYAVLSQRGAMTPKVRFFVDFLRECLSVLRIDEPMSGGSGRCEPSSYVGAIEPSMTAPGVQVHEVSG